MVSELPEDDRFRLLGVGIFMRADGSGARPGAAGLAMFGPHEETWKRLLRRTVKAGWLALMERGGARRGVGGTTVRKASVYAATVPLETWERREGILYTLPFRRPAAEGSGSEASKEAPEDFPPEANPLKEALGEDPSGGTLSKEVPEGFVQDEVAREAQASKEALTGFLQGFTKEAIEALKEALEGFEGSPQGLPHHVVPTSRLSPDPSASVEGSLTAEREKRIGQQADEVVRAWQEARGSLPPDSDGKRRLRKSAMEMLADGQDVELLCGYARSMAPNPTWLDLAVHARHQQRQPDVDHEHEWMK